MQCWLMLNRKTQIPVRLVLPPEDPSPGPAPAAAPPASLFPGHSAQTSGRHISGHTLVSLGYPHKRVSRSARSYILSLELVWEGV